MRARDIYSAYIWYTGYEFYKKILSPGCFKLGKWAKSKHLDLFGPFCLELADMYDEMGNTYKEIARYIKRRGIIRWHIERIKLVYEALTDQIESSDELNLLIYIRGSK